MKKLQKDTLKQLINYSNKYDKLANELIGMNKKLVFHIEKLEKKLNEK